MEKKKTIFDNEGRSCGVVPTFAVAFFSFEEAFCS